MALKEKVIISGGEVRTITMLDRLTPQYWAMENEGLLSPVRPADQPEVEAPRGERERWVSFESTTASANETLGFPLGVTEQEMADYYIRRAREMRAEAFAEGLAMVRNGLVHLWEKASGWVRGFQVDPDDLARPPFSR